MGRLNDYLELAHSRPEWFVNPPGAAYVILLDEKDIRQAEAQQARRLVAQGLPRNWARVGIVYQDQYLCLLRDAVRYREGSFGTYIRFVPVYPTDPAGSESAVPAESGAAGVMVLPVYQDQILLIRHFRHATRSWHLEIPAGGCEPGVSSIENARRELEEELGATAARLISLGVIHESIGMSAEYLELFYAEVASYGHGDILEGIDEIVPVTVDEFERMVREHEITTVGTAAAYTFAKAHGLLPSTSAYLST